MSLDENTQQLSARLRTKMRYGSKVEALRAAYELRIQLEMEEAPTEEVQQELARLDGLIEGLETRGIDPVERRVRQWIDYLGEVRDRFGGGPQFPGG